MIKLPISGHRNPLAPKMKRAPIPVGYVELENAVDALGKDMFSSDWTGEERGFFKAGYAGQPFRSKIEYETDSAFRDAILYAQCEIECELYGGDPKHRYERRKAPVDDDGPFMPMGDLPTLSPEKMDELESRLAREIKEAEGVRDRREKVEDVFLRQLLWVGRIAAHYVGLDGKINALPSHMWGSDEGEQIFNRGWLELDKGGGWTTVRPILIRQTELEDHFAVPTKIRKHIVPGADEEVPSSTPRFSRAKTREWYKSRAERLMRTGERSSRDDDVVAAKEHFGTNIPREFLRELRRELAPEGWTAKGAPKRKN